MEARRVSDSRSELRQFMLAPEGNHWGKVHGGAIMKLVDNAGGAAAMRHCRMPVVTAQLKNMNFLQQVAVGTLVTAKAALHSVGRTSMEVHVTVEAEDLLTGEVVLVATAEAVYVAMGKDGRPAEVPRLISEAGEQKRSSGNGKGSNSPSPAELPAQAMI